MRRFFETPAPVGDFKRNGASPHFSLSRSPPDYFGSSLPSVDYDRPLLGRTADRTPRGWSLAPALESRGVLSMRESLARATDRNLPGPF